MELFSLGLRVGDFEMSFNKRSEEGVVESHLKSVEKARAADPDSVVEDVLLGLDAVFLRLSAVSLLYAVY